ncbi:MAG TPA: His/Gly/Thr/Pro-type tRNA ligase C-terminal domain-containing protein [Candidatus Paceibacterota bacterium]|nr:His/Gly/Thr/Pro-type tRNA ligase C-terminal domain-containing protein [Candidatus Paceibacterota bacterium]
MSTLIIEPTDVLKRAHAVGTYYGFESLAAAAHKNRSNASKSPFPESLSLDALDPHAREVAGFLKSVRDAGLAPSSGRPHFFWHTNAAAGRAAPKQIVIQFHALGADRAIADAVLIRAVRSLATDITKLDSRLRLNSMGDRETRGRLARELGSFFRKRGSSLPADCTESAKKDVFAAAELLVNTPEREGMPSPTDHLSEASRKHFESVLEYLEATDTPYELAPELLSRGGTWNETCFEITAGDRFHAWGSRYNDLAKHFFKSIPSSVGAVIRISTDAVTGGKKQPTIEPQKTSSPRFVFVHIGDEAKRESIKMADALRKARVPMTQVLGVESLTEQMRLADELNPRYLIIMGRKEALERSVILRERATHTETFIPFDGLIDRLRAVA